MFVDQMIEIQQWDMPVQRSLRLLNTTLCFMEKDISTQRERNDFPKATELLVWIE